MAAPGAGWDSPKRQGPEGPSHLSAWAQVPRHVPASTWWGPTLADGACPRDEVTAFWPGSWLWWERGGSGPGGGTGLPDSHSSCQPCPPSPRQAMTLRGHFWAHVPSAKTPGAWKDSGFASRAFLKRWWRGAELGGRRKGRKRAILSRFYAGWVGRHARQRCQGRQDEAGGAGGG